MDTNAATTERTTANTLQYAESYVEAGLSVIPLKLDGTKAVALPSWAQYQTERATESDLLTWFGKNPKGIGIVGGPVSGNLEVIDFDQDAEQTFPEFCNIINAELPGLMERLVIDRTPRP